MRLDQPVRVYVSGIEIDWCVAFDVEEGWADYLMLHPVTKKPRFHRNGMAMCDRVRGPVTVHRESDLNQ